MPSDKAISDHYLHGRLIEAIKAGLAQLGKNTDNVTAEDLGPVDEFHVGGRIATAAFLAQLKFANTDHVLDVGCGLGGAARFITMTYGSRVTGIDLTDEYVETGNVLNNWLGLAQKIDLHQGSALDLPFDDDSFDGACMLHVGMNIEDKAKLFAEVSRVLRPGSKFGVYDLMRQDDGELAYPVPWAKNENTSKLATPDQYRQALADAGFAIVSERNRRDFALEFFAQQRAKTQAEGGPPPLGLHILMQQHTAERLRNLVANVSRGLIAPVEIIAARS